MFYACKVKYFLEQFQKKQYFFGINSIKNNTFKDFAHILRDKTHNNGFPHDVDISIMTKYF